MTLSVNRVTTQTVCDRQLILIWYYVLCLVEKSTRFVYFYIYGEYLTNETLEGFGDFKVAKVIRTIEYTDGLVILVKE